MPLRFCLTGVDPDQVKVRNLTYGQFSPSPDGGSFSVNISWEKPTFNYSTLESYKVSYHSGSINKTTVELSFVSCTASFLFIEYLALQGALSIYNLNLNVINRCPVTVEYRDHLAVLLTRDDTTAQYF